MVLSVATGSALYELLPTVDVVGRARHRCVRQRCTPALRCRPGRRRADRQRRAQLLATPSRSLPSSVADSGVSTNPAAMRFTRIGASSSAMTFVSAGIAAVSGAISANPGSVLPRRAAHEQQGPAGLHLVRREPSDLQRQQEMGLDVATARRLEVRQRHVVRAGAGTSTWSTGADSWSKKVSSRSKSVASKAATLARRHPASLREPIAITPGEDDVGSLGPGAPCRLEPMPALPPITTTVRPSSSSRRVALSVVMVSVMVLPYWAPAISARRAPRASV